MKRIICMFLTFALLLGCIPVTACAENTDNSAQAETSDVVITGSNGFGTMLSAEISEAQEDALDAAEAFYSVSGLTVSGSTAIVTYSAMSQASLVVALYSEDGRQLITSVSTTVSPDETETTLTFSGKMPEYFQASAYLLDLTDLSPLCDSYDTPMYTREMQTLLASTVADYAADRVLNLDDDNTTNFAVYADTTKVIEHTDGSNTLVSADTTSSTYVFENADAQISGLNAGDIFVYTANENDILIVKVSTITENGTTVTITGGDVEIEEVFSAVKFEAEGGTGNATMDTTGASDGITFDGFVSQEQAARSALTDGFEQELSTKFSVNFSGPNEDAVQVSVSGSLSFAAKLGVEYYLTLSYQYAMLQLDTAASFSLSASGKISYFPDLGKLSIPLGAVANAQVGVRAVFRFTGTASVTASVKQTMGCQISHDRDGWHYQDLNAAPHFDMEFGIEGEVFLGLTLVPAIVVADASFLPLDPLLTISLEAELGVTIKGKLSADVDQYDLVHHDCLACIDGDVYVSCQVSPAISFLKNISFDYTVAAVTKKLADFYVCPHHGIDFAWGPCPHYSYRVTVSVVDEEGNSVSGAKVTAGDRSGVTENGLVVFYLPSDYYTVSASSGDQYASQYLSISAPQMVTLILSKTQLREVINAIRPQITDTSVLDEGANGGFTWRLYASGLLTVEGIGKTPWGSKSPWGSCMSQIKKVIIGEGVTDVPAYAFHEAKQLTAVELPDTVTIIGQDAFSGCVALSSMKLSASLETIDNSAFYNCQALTSISLPETLTTIGWYSFKGSGLTSIQIPASVTEISYQAFYSCKSLQSVIIQGAEHIGAACFYNCTALETVRLPETLTSVDQGAWESCEALKDINLPESLTEYPSSLFLNCKSLPSVTIPNTVTSIGRDAFHNTGLTSVSIPASVETLGNSAFYGCAKLETAYVDGNNLTLEPGVFRNCESLTSVTVAGNAASISTYCFSGCTLLESVTLPDAVTAIEQDAFSSCKALSSINMPASLKTIGSSAFYDCKALTSVSLPDTLNTIGWYAYKGAGLTSIVIPASVTEIGNQAFYGCQNLGSVTFLGDAPTISNSAFQEVTATVSYPGGNSTWDGIAGENYSGTLSWVSTVAEAKEASETPDAGTVLEDDLVAAEGTEIMIRTQSYEDTPAEETISVGVIEAAGETPSTVYQVYDGEYSTEQAEGYVLKTASFSGLVPGENYVLLSVISIETDQLLAASNLLTVDQGRASADGTLVFRYIQRVPTDISYVFACGASGRKIRNAEVTFPPMQVSDTLQTVSPTVIYGGVTLTNGVDYIIEGAADYTAAGTYTCYIRGVHNYCGLLECTYTVGNTLRGDFSGDGKVDDGDVAYLLWHTLFPEIYPISIPGDINGDEAVDDTDVAYLLWHTLFPEAYPL